ncbi:MAG TPA: RNA polymerase sigma factor [bacterium]|nr:RNA polymerase sigma factor [bacterium]
MDKETLLIKKAQRGNLQAFEELVRNYDEKLMRILYNMLNNIDDARDVYQEVFLKVFRSLKTYQFKSSFYTWLFRIAVNTCLNYRKKRKRHRYEPLPDDSIAEQGWFVVADQADKNPEQHFLNTELHETINRSIQSLSDQQRTVFVLRHYHGYKLSEIAEIMNCTEGTIKNYMFRSVQKLRKCLQEYVQ